MSVKRFRRELTRFCILLFLRLRDQIFSFLLFSCGLYTVSCKITYENPLRNTPPSSLLIFSVYLGNYVYKFFQDFLLRKELPLYKINLLHHFVTATSYGVLIVYRQNAISGVIGLLFEGSVIAFDFTSLIRLLGASKSGLLFFLTSASSFVITVLLRAISPVALLVHTLSHHSPLSLEYVPLGFFFMNIVFFSMINGWHIKVSSESLKKRLLAARLSYYYSRGEHSDINSNGMELNNFTSPAHSLPHTALPVIIPTDANFRLSSPVSNVNMNSEEVSNIAVSRRERTLPQISLIINDHADHHNEGPIDQV